MKRQIDKLGESDAYDPKIDRIEWKVVAVMEESNTHNLQFD